MANANPTADTSAQSVQFKHLLEEAVSKPGTLMRAYSLFWNYSLGNQLLALIQANNRGIALGPIASFNKWKDLGRFVKRGEKAIELCMPVTCKRTVKEQGDDGADAEHEVTFKRFVYKRNWFMLSQTDGAEYVPPVRRVGPCTNISCAECGRNPVRDALRQYAGLCQGASDRH